MATLPLKHFALSTIVFLTGCTSQSKISDIHHNVSALNREITRLSDQVVKLARQNRLNSYSISGVYLLPGAGSPALLNSQSGMMRMSLADIRADNNDTRAVLYIWAESRAQLPAFTGLVEYGQLQNNAGRLQEVNVQRLNIRAPSGVQATSNTAIPLLLQGITPEQLGFVRVHRIQPLRR